MPPPKRGEGTGEEREHLFRGRERERGIPAFDSLGARGKKTRSIFSMVNGEFGEERQAPLSKHPSMHPGNLLVSHGGQV